MKRLFSIFCVLLIVLNFVAFSCYAQETDDEMTVETEAPVESETVETGEEDELGGADNPIKQTQDWLTEFWETLMSHKDDIMAAILFIVATLYELGSKRLSKKVLPMVQAQSKTNTSIANATGKVVEANREYFERAIEALEVSEKTKEQYRVMCEKYKEQNEKVIKASLSLEQMIYEALMSAKLSDLRKEEIERQHIMCKRNYEALLDDLKDGDVDEAVDP